MWWEWSAWTGIRWALVFKFWSSHEDRWRGERNFNISFWRDYLPTEIIFTFHLIIYTSTFSYHATLFAFFSTESWSKKGRERKYHCIFLHLLRYSLQIISVIVVLVFDAKLYFISSDWPEQKWCHMAQPASPDLMGNWPNHLVVTKPAVATDPNTGFSLTRIGGAPRAGAMPSLSQ